MTILYVRTSRGSPPTTCCFAPSHTALGFSWLRCPLSSRSRSGQSATQQDDPWRVNRITCLTLKFPWYVPRVETRLFEAVSVWGPIKQQEFYVRLDRMLLQGSLKNIKRAKVGTFVKPLLSCARLREVRPIRCYVKFICSKWIFC